MMMNRRSDLLAAAALFLASVQLPLALAQPARDQHAIPPDIAPAAGFQTSPSRSDLPTAATDCTSAEDRKLLQRATAEVDDWEARKQATLTPELRDELAREFCKAGMQLMDEYGVSSDEIANKARAPISGYLDTSLGSSQRVTALEDRMVATVLSGSSPALPEPRRMGVIRMTYRATIDRVELNGKAVAQSPMYITSLGNKSLAGFRGSTRACGGNVTVGLTPVNFTC